MKKEKVKIAMLPPNPCSGECGICDGSCRVSYKVKVIKKKWNRKELEQLIHQAVNDSHCSSNRVKQPNSNRCAEFVNTWIEKYT